MNTICPLCNGLTALTGNCPRCGGTVEDGGQWEGYEDPYYPYEDDLLVPAPNAGTDARSRCWHLVYCSRCGWEGTHAVSQQPEL